MKYLAGTVLVLAAAIGVGLSRLIWYPAVPILGIVAVAFAGLAGSNILYDRGVPVALSRRLAPVLGGAAYLVAVLWLDAWTAITVVGVLTVFILILRLGFRRGLRGVQGSRRSQDWAEVTYPVAGTLSLLAAWGILGDRWLAFLPVAFMAWGDSAAGLARETARRDHAASIWPSMAMLMVCLGAAALFRPYWIGAVGAVVATAGERYRPGALRFLDDNLNIVAASLTIMAVLARISS